MNQKLYYLYILDQGVKKYYAQTSRGYSPDWSEKISNAKRYTQPKHAITVVNTLIRLNKDDSYNKDNIFIEEFEIVPIGSMSISMKERNDKIEKIKVKTFESFMNEKASEAIQLTILITDDGEEVEGEGYYEPGVGIFDYDGKEYPSGIGVDGNKYSK